MYILKDVLVFSISAIALCLFIIFFNHIGIPPIFNLCLSAFIYGVFCAYCFHNTKFILSLLSIFYISILFMSLDSKVILMFLITLISYLNIKPIINYLLKIYQNKMLNNKISVFMETKR